MYLNVIICLHVNNIDQVCEVILLLLTRNHIPEFTFLSLIGNNGRNLLSKLKLTVQIAATDYFRLCTEVGLVRLNVMSKYLYGLISESTRDRVGDGLDLLFLKAHL